MNNQEQFLTEALQRAVQVVDTVEDRYREAAFPIILQALIGPTRIESGFKRSSQESNGYQASEPSLPPTLSVYEFFRRVDPDTHPARFVTADYYLRRTGKAYHTTQAVIPEVVRKR